MATVTRYWPFGPHYSSGGNIRGIGDIWHRLNSIGIPCHFKSVDVYGPIWELMQSGDLHGVDNVCVYRPKNMAGRDLDVPNWFADSPEAAAQEHVDIVLSNLPSEFDKRVWLEIINEPDKDTDDRFPGWESEEFANWLGRFLAEAARLLLDRGYRFAAPGFSSGEPELPDWETPGMLSWLRLCASNKDLAVATHEYSYNGTSLQDAKHPIPWLLGRFTKLFEVCDRHGIKRPQVLVTEFGWTLNDMPPTNEAIAQLLWAAEEIYGPHPEILSVAIWHFGGGFSDLANKAQTLLEPMADLAETWRMVVPVDDTVTPPPDDDNRTDKERWWDMLVKEQVENGLQLAPTALQDAIRADGFHPVTKEAYYPGEPPMMAAEDWETRTKARRHYVYVDGRVAWFNDPRQEEPTPDPPPEPEPDPPPPGGAIDLLPYFVPNLTGNGPLYEVKRAHDGSQARIQTQAEPGGFFYIAKGAGGKDGKSEWEQLRFDPAWIWRGLDTSPGEGRFYIQFEPGSRMARWCPRFMSVGQTWYGPGHRVQFYFKDSCSPSSENSGPATNVTTFFAHHSSLVFNGITVNDIIEIGRIGGERFWFARGLGMVGWQSGWNSSFISELHPPGARPDNTREPLCDFVLP